MDVLDLEEVDQADVVAALADAEDVMDVEEHALENVVAHALGHVEVAALGHVEDVVGVQDVEDHVQAHARQVEKARLVLHAIAAPDALVHVLRVLRVVDVVGVMDVVGVAAVRPVATAVVAAQEDAMDHVVADAQEDVAVVLVVVRDVMVVVMNAVDNVKTHVLLPAQQRVLVHVKLKHLEL